MINRRNKGCAYERQIRRELINLGWKDCQTTRFANHELDNQLVDYVNTDPFQIQAKAMEKSPPYHNILKSMPQNSKHNVIIHKRNRLGEVAVMEKETFYHLIKLIKNEKKQVR